MAYKKHIIYSNLNPDEDSYKEAFEEWCEINDYDPEEKSLDEYIADSLNIWFEDEQMNLDKECGDIIAIADLGLWNGRHSAYQINKAHNLNAIFGMLGRSADYIEIYVEGNDIKAKAIHHDGTNYITFREVRPERNIQILCDKLYEGEEVTSKMITYYTKPLGRIPKEVYGW